MEKHGKAIISGSFTIILLLMGYLWNANDKRIDSMEERHLTLVNGHIDLSAEVSELRGMIGQMGEVYSRLDRIEARTEADFIKILERLDNPHP